jgi:hypothetical protein
MNHNDGFVGFKPIHAWIHDHVQYNQVRFSVSEIFNGFVATGNRLHPIVKFPKHFGRQLPLLFYIVYHQDGLIIPDILGQGYPGPADNEGVAAQRSAVKTVSWPTAETIGTPERAIAQATPSSLKEARSSRKPPPRVNMITSKPGKHCRSAMARMISAGDSVPCTRTGAIRMSIDGNYQISAVVTRPILGAGPPDRAIRVRRFIL